MPNPEPPEEVMILNRSDMVAGFQMWVETWRMTPREIIEAMLANTTDSTAYAEAAADTFIEFLIESSQDPIVDRP
jgi:hypothetical protein